MGRLRLAKSTGKRIDRATIDGNDYGQDLVSMQQPAGASERGYANTALVLALCHVLASKGVLTRNDLDAVVTDAISELEAADDSEFGKRAINVLKSLLPRIREHLAPGR
jgi:hypothetical protein